MLEVGHDIAREYSVQDVLSQVSIQRGRLLKLPVVRHVEELDVREMKLTQLFMKVKKHETSCERTGLQKPFGEGRDHSLY